MFPNELFYSKTARYYVLDECALGIVYDEQPEFFHILAATRIEHAGCDRLAVPMFGDGMRDADFADFDKFRVSAKGYFIRQVLAS